MSAAAQREDPTGTEATLAGQANGTDGAPGGDLRQLAAQRLAAHRHRRAAVAALPRTAAGMADGSLRDPLRGQARGPMARPGVRDAVAARYRHSPTYQEFLAAEAARSLEKAQAEAEVAARNALAVADAQRQLLEEIEQWNQPTAPPPLFVVDAHSTPEGPGPLPADWQTGKPTNRNPKTRPPANTAASATEGDPAPLKVQLFADLPAAQFTPTAAVPGPPTLDAGDLETLGELDGEIAFRLAPEFEDHIVETLPIQGNIIQFPRQLVAPRKARPRLAEGPLREDGTPEPQLRIFEVDPGQFSTEPDLLPAAAPAWQSLLLPTALSPQDGMTDGQAAADPGQNIAPLATTQIHAAPVSRRVMAMAVDGVCIGTAFVGFCALTVRLCGPPLSGSPLGGLPLPVLGTVAAVALLAFSALYQLLFFCFNEATPGMLYARLGLCTFADSNPSRRAVRRRLWATAVAVSPLGLGLLWIALDPDRLGWHDRISRMYPRAY